MNALCPCCGSPVNVATLEDAAERFPGAMGEIIRCLSDGRRKSIWVLADYVFEDDPNGGPRAPENNIKVTISRNRKKLRELGWEIEGFRGPPGGYQMRVAQ